MTTSWTHALFNGLYVKSEGLQHSTQKTILECRLILKLLKFGAQDHVLDLACGHGRHTLEFARQGFSNIVGLDYSIDALEMARLETVKHKNQVEFVQADMRHLEFVNEFDVIYNVYNSLFYWDDSTHLEMLRGIFKALKPGGKFLLDVYNRESKLANLMLEQHPVIGRWRRVRKLISSLKRIVFNFSKPRTNIVTNSRFDLERGVMFGSKKILQHNKILEEHSFEVRLYSLTELRALLEQAGFCVEQVCSSPDGGQYRLSSSRLIVVAQKPSLVGALLLDSKTHLSCP